MEFSKNEKFIFDNQLKGLKGEQLFDSYLQQIENKGLIISDLTLSNEGKIFQIDLLLFFNNKVYLYEVKNYFGNYIYTDNEIFTESGFRVLNPLGQLNRSKTYLSYIFKNIGLDLTIEANVVFIHPEFYLYSAPLNKPFIFSAQLPRHIQSLMEQQTIRKSQYIKLAKKLVEQNIDNYRSDNLPTYNLDLLKKGVCCPECSSFESTNTKTFRICSYCGFREKIRNAVLRNIEEFILLFPDESITTNKMYHWCGRVYNKRRIQRILKSEYKTLGMKNGTYYVKHNEED